ncbi:MAG: hypothetical protein A3F68_02635 [Acidobacteria bacterium RIFCSPLOWO2_12_FULL_54_10]|nr:MAG: hypothetical protein A3F68_02635 [Acidobacteria bacterium RIFCSPLOWO2_12_FULL_54_10]
MHLPVQSGSNNVLRRMAREYTREQYLERIALLRQANRPISISTDIIVGFPGETDADFEQSISLLDQVGYDLVFSFEYSPRPNTPSLHFDGVVPGDVKTLRLRILMERQQQIQIQRFTHLVASTEELLVEGPGGREGQWKGRTSQNIIVNFSSIPSSTSVPQPGSYWNVRITKAGPNSLVGEAIEGPLFSANSPEIPPVHDSPFRIIF